MSTETHVNTLVQDVNDARDAALGALHAYGEKVDQLRVRLMQEAGMLEHAAEAGVKAAEDDYKEQKDKKESSSSSKKS